MKKIDIPPTIQAIGVFENIFQKIKCLDSDNFLDIETMNHFSYEISDAIQVLETFFEEAEKNENLSTNDSDEINYKLFNLETNMQRFNNDYYRNDSTASNLFEHFKASTPYLDDVVELYCQVEGILRMNLGVRLGFIEFQN